MFYFLLEVLQRVKEERDILQIIKRKQANWIGHILRRNCLLKHFIEGNTKGIMEMAGIREIRCKKLLHVRKGNYWITENAGNW